MTYLVSAAADLSTAFKLFESFRKGSHRLSHNRIDADSVFVSECAGCPVLRVFRGKESAALSLPNGHVLPGTSFSLPYCDLLAFIKSTKAKGLVSLKDATLSADNGSQRTVTVGPSLQESECGELQTLLSAATDDTVSMLSDELDSEPVAVPVPPLITAARFTADDASKLILSGIQFSGSECAATNGHYLRRVPVWLPPSAGKLPDSLWLPCWIASTLESVLKAKERDDSVLYCLAKKYGLQSIRFSVPSVNGYALIRYSDCEATYPNYNQLIPDSLPFRFELNRATFLESVRTIVDALKQSDGDPRIDFKLIPLDASIELSATIKKKANAKKYCSDYLDVGTSSTTLPLPYAAILPQHPTESADWPTLKASSRDKLRQEYKRRTTFSFNVDYLKTSLESFESDIVELSWAMDHTPFLLTGTNSQDVALIMPIQVRK